MIKGIGTDIVGIKRIESIIKKHGNRFMKKVFSADEILFCNGKVLPAIHFSGRWAAKEAFYKALPRSCQVVSSWKSIQIQALDGSGKPFITVISDTLKHCLAKESISSIHLTISHEQEFCVAFVVLE